MAIFEHSKHKNRRVCMLIVTHACNLQCSYCYESHKGNKKMSFEVAKQCILREVDFVKKSSEFTEIEIDFMGGEPLLNFDLIRKVVEWMECARLGIPFITGCATNGTLLTPEMKVWMKRHNRFFLPGLSYDGNKQMQKTNRGVADVDVDFFVNVRAGNQLHITISRSTLSDFAEGVMYIQRKGGSCTCALAQGIDWTPSDALIFRRELKKLAATYLKEETIKPLHFLTRPLYEIGKSTSAVRKYCGTGKGMITYDVDGMSYPCHMFTPLVTGPMHASVCGWDVCSEKSISDPYCVSCIYKNWCPTCYGFNLHLRGDTAIRDHGWCPMVDAWARSACEFQLLYYDKHRQRITAEDRNQIRAAINTYWALNNIGGNWRTGCL